MKKEILFAALFLLAAEPASAQVFDEAKMHQAGQKNIAAKMQAIDLATIGKTKVATVGTGGSRKQIDRQWVRGPLSGFYPPLEIGYSYATPSERVAFALAYENWLRENGESSSDIKPLVPYAHRLSFADQWWSKHSVARFRAQHPSEWAASSLADAGFLIRETARALHVEGSDGDRNDKELAAVCSKSIPEVKKNALTAVRLSGKNQFSPELLAVDEDTIGCTLNIAGKPVQRVWESGYGATTAIERTKFAYEYLAFLDSHGGTSTYVANLNWSEQWWTDNCEAYRAQPPASSLSVSPYKAWARDSIVDAELLGYLASQQLGLLNPEAEKHYQLAVLSEVEAARRDYVSNDSKVPSKWLPN